MSGREPAAVQAAWADALCAALADAGVRELVASPGSRSTPILLAALRQGRLRCHAIVDERSAGFFALGQARATGRPSALLCTSGSAGAHYYPAVIEAAAGHLPLVAITADRPPALQGCAAPQTIDQTRLFGAHARLAIDVGTPEERPDALRALRRRVLQAVAAALAPEPGPVQINVPLRQPLEPPAGWTAEPSPAPPAGGTANSSISLTSSPALPASLAELAAACRRASRGVIVAGPALLAQAAAAPAIARLARRLGYPLLAESASQLRFAAATAEAPRCDAFDLLLRTPSGRRRLAPELVLQLGAPPTSPGYAQLAADPTLERHVIAAWGWPDPQGTARVHPGDPGATAAALDELLAAEPLPDGPARAAFAASLAAADRAAWRCVDEALRGETRLGEGAVARALVEALPAGAALAVGNSLPVRLVDGFCPGGPRGLALLAQRGANGIDGLVSSAAGAASVAARPLALLIGDVSFSHDVGGLALAREATSPLVLVVIDNQGGRLFEQLPIAAAATPAELERFWLTPPRLDLAAAATAFGLPYRRAGSRADLEAALAAALARPGATLLHVEVDPHGAAAQRAALAAAVEAALAAEATP